MPKRKLALVSKGNKKLGPSVYHTNTKVGPEGSCGDTVSSWCAAHCYAMKGHYTFPSVRTKYDDNFEMLKTEPSLYEAELTADVAELPLGSIFRWHTGGDIYDVGHVGIIRRVCESRPDIQFFVYTRRWQDESMRRAIEEQLFELHNLTVWGSTDPSLPSVPEGWREARVFDSFSEATKGGFGVHCPEQTGRRPDCESCGLCWKATPQAKLAFATH